VFPNLDISAQPREGGHGDTAPTFGERMSVKVPEISTYKLIKNTPKIMIAAPNNLS